MKKATLAQYYRLAKPGIVYGNLLTTVAALFFASRWHFIPQSLTLFLATVIGLGLVIASACVFNNYLDRDMDKRMARTKERPLVTGTISVRSALIYATVLGLAGALLLSLLVNLLSAGLALFGFVFYVIIYGLAKRGSSWGAVVGSVSGAVPIVVGYAAVTDRLDGAALILFLILVLWQMPHFYAIATYRLEEYRAAGVPVLPAEKGIRRTKIHIVSYIVALIVAECALTVFGYAGYCYLVAVLLFSLAWLFFGIQGFFVEDDIRWARKVFLYSLIVIVSFSFILAVAPLLP